MSAGESRLFYLNSMKTLMENQKVKMENEMKAYMSSDPTERKKSFRYVTTDHKSVCDKELSYHHD